MTAVSFRATLLVGGLVAACGRSSDDGGRDPTAEDRSSFVTLRVSGAYETNPLGDARAERGRYVVVDVEVENRTGLPLSAAPPAFSVETSAGLQRAADPIASLEVRSRCPVDALVADGASVDCMVAFELPYRERATAILFPSGDPDEPQLRVPLEAHPCDRCGDDCVDLDEDPAHCGACNTAVASGASCVDGVPTCDLLGFQDCGGTCVDVLVDPEHCGGCNKRVAAREVCEAGFPTCSSDFPLDCDAGCVQPLNDKQNCGACGRSVPQGGLCRDGEPACPVLRPDECGGQCVNTQFDFAHCGTCDAACRLGFLCVGGTCAVELYGETRQVCSNVCASINATCGAVSVDWTAISSAPTTTSGSCGSAPPSSMRQGGIDYFFDAMTCVCVE